MKQFIYILTDNNRKNLHVGLTHDLEYTMHYYKEMHSVFFDSKKKMSRLVYFEEVSSLDTALEKFKTISAYTRAQKERLIRLTNTNWNDLSVQPVGATYDRVNQSYAKLVFAS